MKKVLTVLLTIMMLVGLSACGSDTADNAGKTVYKVCICNYVDDASLNQIVQNIKDQLSALETDEIAFEVEDQNCNGDAAVMNQIISDYINSGADLLVGVATPVAMAMQGATEDIPVVFAAVSDPVSCGIVESLEEPGANVTGTSDYLDTTAVMNLILAQNPGIDKVGLLYDQGQDSSTSAIASAKEFLADNNIEVVEKTGTTVDEISLAVDSLISSGVKVIFTPSDNTVMTAELSIYEKLAENGVQHYAGADSFALNGAFVGYGVDYANLGKETANMINEILVEGKDPSTLPVKQFDNGIATVNTDVCKKLGLKYEEVETNFKDYCTAVKEITTAESFD